MNTDERLRVTRGVAWVAIWATVAILLVWLAVPIAKIVRDGGVVALLKEDFRFLFFGVAALMLGIVFGIAHFLPLYCVDVFLWCGVRRVLETDEHRAFKLVMCAIGVLVSAGIIAWYAREAVLLEIREFFIWGRTPS